MTAPARKVRRIEAPDGNRDLPIWSVWFVPTEKGKQDFGWRERRCGDPFYATQDDAAMEVYLQSSDWQVPDRHLYGGYELRTELGGIIPSGARGGPPNV